MTPRFAGYRCRRLALGLLVLTLGCERAGAPPEPGSAAAAASGHEQAAASGHEQAAASGRQQAARRGIEWLLASADSMGPDWAFAIFGYLEPLVREPSLALRCGEALDRAAREPLAALPSELDDPELLRLPRLRPIVAELRRRQWAGEPYEPAAAQLEALLRKHSAEFWRRAPLLQQLTFLDSFAQLGIDAHRGLEDVVAELRARWQRGRPEVLLEDAGFVFALTHVLYTASGYFRRYPDAAVFGPEIGMLRQALRRYLTVPAPRARHFLDLEAELLVALRLLRVPEDDDMRAMAERLIRLQNPDGSWGEASGNHAFHATAVAVQALSDWPAAFDAP